MKNLKNQKGTSLITAILVVLILIVGAVLFKLIINSNSIENKVLSEYNFQETLQEYAKLEGKSDNLAYVIYAMMYHSLSDYAFNYFTNGNLEFNEQFSSIYGKTIKDLKKEGKELMEENNVDVDNFKYYLNNL